MSTKKQPNAYLSFQDLAREFGPRSVGRVLKAFREADEVPQAEFARWLGISRANLCDIEKGRKQVSLERAAKFAKVLGLPAELLVQYAIEEQLRAAKLKFKVEVYAA